MVDLYLSWFHADWWFIGALSHTAAFLIFGLCACGDFASAPRCSDERKFNARLALFFFSALVISPFAWPVLIPGIIIFFLMIGLVTLVDGAING